MSDEVPEAVTGLLAALQAKDLDGALRWFADDALVIDPHYPMPRMAGKAAIAAGLQWAFGALDQMRFSPQNVWVAPDGASAAAEVATAHTLRGRPLRFTQTFVLELRDGRITRLQSYTPYGPPGIGGLMLGLLRLGRRLRAARRQS